MPKSIKVLTNILLLLSISFSPLMAMKKVAQSKMQFLKLGVGARAAAMGDAFTAQAGDPNSIFYNPGACATLPGISIAVNQTSWIAGIDHKSAALSFTTGRWGVFNVNYITMDYGTMERTVVDAHAWEGYRSEGDFSVDEYAIGVGYSKSITDRFSLGGQAKYIFQNLGSTQIWRYIGSDFETSKVIENDDDVVAYDFGTYYDAGFKGLGIGMAVQNFANKALPLTFRFGISMRLNELLFPKSELHALMIAFDALHPRDYSERVHFGLEYAFKNTFFLRAGHKINYDEEGLAGGFGVRFSVKGIDAIIDYAITDLGVLGTVNRFTLNFQM